MKIQELSNNQLIFEFMNSCARAGFSNSGMVISSSASHDYHEAHDYKNEVLRRLTEQPEPPHD